MTLGLQVHRLPATGPDVICAVTTGEKIPPERLAKLPGVLKVEAIPLQFPLASRAFCPMDTPVRVGPVEVGGPEIVLTAGPCAVESEDQVFQAARAVRAAGAKVLRGGAFKPRTSPYSFQGLGVAGLQI